MKFLIVLVLGSLFLTGCLQTRNDVRENEQRSQYQQQVATQQRMAADAGTRVSHAVRNVEDAGFTAKRRNMERFFS